ncbi:carbohydrate family 9 binding domain-like protein [Nitzschia inconspicua]|uniref:Carbohydrate family 9 binding domain-like protein n=1 Tax=Nitzschia inconspicua TaxID=303405 RepID=A0A9K3KGI8_9STRA|nr:carbohydrate family 9 binding domain-like protein [Nitzschia inconspicua]
MASASQSPVSSSPFQPHWNLYPRTYVVPKISFPLLDHLDGDLTKDVWKDVPFSDVFDDIRGATDSPAEDRPNPQCRTRFKAVWDETHLYIGAILQSDFETQAHFTERNAPIFQKDSDFEVFVDMFGSCHHYKELEVNAINTPWNLMLDKPYDDGGVEHSGRIAKPGDDLYYEVEHQKTATKVISGKLNDPKNPATWSIEVALSYRDLLAHVKGKEHFVVRPGSMLRINFSRVEKQGAMNWTWQPQIVWDPHRRRYAGYVAMHLPDSWGYFVLGDQHHARENNPNDLVAPKDPSWPGRLAAMNIYYAQKAYSQQNGGTYATTVTELIDLVDAIILEPFRVEINLTKEGYVANLAGNPDGSIVTVRQDRLLSIAQIDQVTISTG